MEQVTNPTDPTYMQVNLHSRKQSMNPETNLQKTPSTQPTQLITKEPPKSPGPRCNPNLEIQLLNRLERDVNMEEDFMSQVEETPMV